MKRGRLRKPTVNHDSFALSCPSMTDGTVNVVASVSCHHEICVQFWNGNFVLIKGNSSRNRRSHATLIRENGRAVVRQKFGLMIQRRLTTELEKKKEKIEKEKREALL